MSRSVSVSVSFASESSSMRRPFCRFLVDLASGVSVLGVSEFSEFWISGVQILGRVCLSQHTPTTLYFTLIHTKILKLCARWGCLRQLISPCERNMWSSGFTYTPNPKPLSKLKPSALPLPLRPFGPALGFRRSGEGMCLQVGWV